MVSTKNNKAVAESSSFISSQMCFYFAIYASILICWTLALYIHTPPSGDHGYLLSPALSLLRGDFLRSTFADPALDPYVFPYLYSLITAPLIALTRNPVVTPFVISLTFIIAVSGVTYIFLKRSGAHISVIVLSVGLMLSNTYFWNGRVEVVASAFLIGVLISLKDLNGNRFGLIQLSAAGVMVTCSSLLHPISGVAGFILVFTIIFARVSWKVAISQYLIFLGLSTTFLLITYGPVALADLNHFLSSYTRFLGAEPRSSNILKAPQYFLIAPGLFLCYVWLLIVDLRKNKTGLPISSRVVREIAYFTPIILFLILQGTSYYFPLVTPFLLWRIAAYAHVRLKYVAVLLLLVSPMFSHYLPTVQYLENPQYGESVQKAITTATQEILSDANAHRYWVSGDLGMVSLKVGENVHRFTNLTLKHFPTKELRAGDIVFFTQSNEQEWLNRFMDREAYDYQLETLIPETKGLVTLDSLFRDRSDGVGLWKAIIKDKVN